MQKFGIEIRKSGNLANLYKDVDMVLKKAQNPDGDVSDLMKMQTVPHSLQKGAKAVFLHHTGIN